MTALESSIDFAPLLGELRTTFAEGTTKPLGWRVEQLRALLRLVEENDVELLAALATDLGKPRLEG